LDQWWRSHAASAFLGATIHAGQILKWGALPLLLFYVGLMAAGRLWIGNLFYHWTKEHVPPEAVEMVASKTLAARMGQWADLNTGPLILISFFCFVFGGIFSVAVVLLS
jgi:hypothetical protein